MQTMISEASGTASVARANATLDVPNAVTCFTYYAAMDADENGFLRRIFLDGRLTPQTVQSGSAPIGRDGATASSASAAGDH